MPVITRPEQFNVSDLFVDVSDLVDHPLYLKCEGANLAGSVKLKTARGLVDDAERVGQLRPGMVIVESSSGNLGVALAMVAAARGYGFICVTDARCTPTARRLMAAVGARVEVVSRACPQRGLLGARLDRVAELACLPGHVWLDQYANAANPRAHEKSTGPEVHSEFPDLAVLFVGVGSAGTAVGCSRYFRRVAPETRLVGVDSVGSITFGGPPGPRHIPGIGAGVAPPQYGPGTLDDEVYVTELDSISMCRRLARRGFLFGGSTGTVLAGAVTWLQCHPGSGTAVALAADFGDRYLDTIFHDLWVADVYGADLLRIDAQFSDDQLGLQEAS